MWGNLTGWIISAVIAAGLGGLLFYVAAPPSITDPTNSPKLAVAYKELTLPVSADSVVSPGAGGGDAGDLYRQAMDDYDKNIAVYEKFDQSPSSVKENQLAGIALVLQARDCKTCTLFAKDFSKVINYNNEEPELAALKALGNACIIYGMLYTAKDEPNPQPEKAVQLWEAAFVLGYHLYDERASWLEYQAGHELMQNAANRLGKYYDDRKEPDKADKFKKFNDEEGAQAMKLVEALKIITAVDESFAGGYAGDIYKIAQDKNADKMLRAEAVKHLGHYRFNATTRGDQLGANRAITNLMQDPQPNVKAAATAAHDLTVEGHRMVG